MVRRASVAFLALVTTVGLTFLKHTVSATETSRRSLLQTDTFSYQNTGFCTRENVLYASVGIGCGALRDFAEEDEDRKNACCLILSELNEEKCFCENKVAPILQQSQFREHVRFGVRRVQRVGDLWRMEMFKISQTGLFATAPATSIG